MTIPKKQMFNLLILYNEPHRHYHTSKHIYACLRELEDFVENSDVPLTSREVSILEHSIWYHDAIYNPFSKNNEENSANLLESTMMHKENDYFDYDETQEIKQIILCTKNHERKQEKGFNLTLQDIMIDIDLSIFGQSNLIYKQYSDSIRKEYEHIEDNTFYIHRKNILSSFLNKKKIYKTRYFYDKYENLARENLKKELEEITQLDFI